MAEDETAIREVNQSIAEDRQAEFLRKQGPILLGCAAVLILGVAGWQAWKGQMTRAAEDASIAYWEAEGRLNEEPETGEAAYQLIAESDTSGYAALARFKLASVATSDGETDAALAHYESIYNDTAAPKRIQDLARLKAGYVTIAKGYDETLEIVGSLEGDQSPLGDYAREIIALSALEAQDYETAETLFLAAAGSPIVPTALRTRAEQFVALASAGKAGVVLEAKSEVEGFLDALGEKGSDLGAVLKGTDPHQDGDDGHDHSLNDVHMDGHTDGVAPGRDVKERATGEDAATRDTDAEDTIDATPPVEKEE